MIDPAQILQKMTTNSQIMRNPMARNIMNMAKSGDISGIEQFGRNIARERGVDFTEEFNKFRRNFPM